MKVKDLFLPAYAQMLEALLGQIDKAKHDVQTAGGSFAELLAARLAPDMFPLASQIHFVCTQAEEARARLIGEAPDRLDTPATFDAARTLLADTVQRLRAAATDERLTDQDTAVELALPNGMVFDMTTFEYFKSWSMPQFYFHLVTAYAIMRNRGIAIGKADYVPHMFQFLRKT